ncbi:hypothetical protein J132_05974 [Termitomyces sp. J132]|nr:hypothetical protein J132_05974 [Termitomyces sp. J132]
MILGFTWLHEHNPEIDWTKGEVKMSCCPCCCITCAEEAHKEQRAKVCEHAAVCACCAGHLPYADLDLLSPPPLAFPHREALYKDVWGVGCEFPEEEEAEGEWTCTSDEEPLDETIEVGDWISATLCPPPIVAEIQASQTTSQHLAEAFVANSQPKPFHSTVPNHLHDFEDVFSKAFFDSLLEHKQWDHAVELILDAEPSSCKVYPLVPHEQDELDAFLQENMAPVDPSLEFLMDDLTAGMMVSAPAVTSASNTAKHLVGALVVARGEGWSEGCGDNEAANCGDIQEVGALATPLRYHLVGALVVARGEGWSEGCGDNEAANCGDIQEVGPSTPKAAAGGVTRGLAMLPRLATTLRSKGKGKGKAWEEEDKDIEDQIEETFTDKHLATLLHWRKASTVVDTGLGAGVKLEKAKGKVTVSLEKRQDATTAGPIMTQRAAGTPLGSSPVIAMTEGAVVGGGGGTKVKSREVVETLAQKQAASPTSVASKEREGDVEMRETTPLAMVTEAEREASDMEVEGEEELKAVPAAAEEDKEEERAEEAKVRRRGTWSDTPLHQVGNNELEWLGKDLGWLTLLTSAASLVDFDKRVAGVERQFQRELEAAREELLVVRACYTVTKQTLATLVGYQHDCQAFLAWQEENNIREGDWEEAEAMEVPDDNADLDA